MVRCWGFLPNAVLVQLAWLTDVNAFQLGGSVMVSAGMLCTPASVCDDIAYECNMSCQLLSSMHTVLLSLLQVILETLDNVPDGLTNPCVVDTGAIDALAAILQVGPTADAL